MEDLFSKCEYNEIIYSERAAGKSLGDWKPFCHIHPLKNIETFARPYLKRTLCETINHGCAPPLPLVSKSVALQIDSFFDDIT